MSDDEKKTNKTSDTTPEPDDKTTPEEDNADKKAADAYAPEDQKPSGCGLGELLQEDLNDL